MMITKVVGILIFGSLLLLSFLLIVNPLRVNKKANAWFGIFLLDWASFWGDEVVYLSFNLDIELSSMLIPGFVQFFTPILFFTSVRYFTNPNYKFGSSGLTYLITPLIYLFLQIFQTINSNNYDWVLILFVLIHTFFYTVISFLLIRKHQKRIQQFTSNTLGINLNWLEYIAVVLLCLMLIVTIFNLVYYDAPLNLFMNGVIYLVVLFTAYHSLKQKEIFPVDEQERKDVIVFSEKASQNAVRRKIISDERLVEIKLQLNVLMLKEEPYLNSDLSLVNLAKQLKITSHQLSYVINNGFNENFYGFINGYRVEKAKKLLADKGSKKLSMVGVAFESGFNSKTAFNTTFKKITGQTPSAFKKKCSDL